jgi:hypothetical protein
MEYLLIHHNDMEYIGFTLSNRTRPSQDESGRRANGRVGAEAGSVCVLSRSVRITKASDSEWMSPSVAIKPD